MSRLRAVAVNLARESGRSADVIEYGLKVGLYNLAGIIGVIVVGYALGVFSAALTAYVASGSLRLASGGGHAATPLRCIVLTSLQFGAIGLVAHYGGPLCAGLPLVIGSAIVLAWVLYAILRFAPRDVPNKPINKERGRRLKKWAVIIWCVWTVLIVWALAGVSAGLILSALLGLGFQGLSLVPKSRKNQGVRR
jgi:accessory gene regulator B